MPMFALRDNTPINIISVCLTWKPNKSPVEQAFGECAQQKLTLTEPVLLKPRVSCKVLSFVFMKLLVMCD